MFTVRNFNGRYCLRPNFQQAEEVILGAYDVLYDHDLAPYSFPSLAEAACALDEALAVEAARDAVG